MPTQATDTATPPSRTAGAWLVPLLVRFRSVFALSVLVVFLSLATESFWSEKNLQNVLRQISVNLCLSVGMTLEPGDCLFTGTPGGVGAAMEPRQFLKAGDVVRCEIDTLGAIEGTMIAER